MSPGVLSPCQRAGDCRTPLATAVGGSAFGLGRYSTVLPLQGWRLRRPQPTALAPASRLALCARRIFSAYAYTPSGASPAESAHALKQSVPLAAAKSPAHGTFWPWGLQSSPSSLPTGGSVRPPAPSAADPRRVASSRDTATLPRSRLGASDANRSPAAALRSVFGLAFRPRPRHRWRLPVRRLCALPTPSEPLSSLASGESS